MGKILIIGGVAESLWRFRGPLIRQLVARGHEVVACAPEIEERTKSRVHALGAKTLTVDLDRHGKNPLIEMWRVISLKRVLASAQPDAVLAYTIKPVILGSFAAALAGVPRVFSMITGLGVSFLNETLRQRMLSEIVTKLYTFALRSNERVIFQNEHDSQVFLRRRIVKDAAKVVVVNGSGVDLDRFQEVEAPCQSCFLLMARLIREKGIYEFVEAAGRLRARYPGVKFQIAGWMEKGRSAISSAQIAAWTGAGIVEYLGVVDDVRPVIARSSVVVLPSYYPEGVPRSLLEGMAVGRPIITSDTPGCRETVIRGLNGFLVPPKDVTALAEAMERFIINPGLVGEMGRQGRKIVEQRFDATAVSDQIINAIFPSEANG